MQANRKNSPCICKKNTIKSNTEIEAENKDNVRSREEVHGTRHLKLSRGRKESREHLCIIRVFECYSPGWVNWQKYSLFFGTSANVSNGIVLVTKEFFQ